ncbi:hypothetical protein LUZ61_007230 [Rhynchospora tenuis]|uniref:Reverse transcriptase zinc-binding domain-containing protein n=1 Tax=Rhynchospora tenuis TaxID=198213 RepID=A0AAD6EWF0_9POAL|nr:hypothetical protein LUZ61_007230 [Rhynchospora tenuis]
MFSTVLPATQLATHLQLLTTNLHSFNLGTQLQDDLPLWKLLLPSYKSASMYSLLKCNPLELSPLRLLWNLRAPPRILTFGWQLLQQRLPTTDVLQKRGWQLPNRCYHCTVDEETATHISFHCQLFKQVSALVYQLASISCPMTGDTFKLLQCVRCDKKQRELLLITCFVLWRERCDRLFNSRQKNFNALVEDTLSE